MPYLLLALFVLGLLLGPQLWVRWVLWRHDRDREELTHTGAGLANWLIQELGLHGVSVEETARGDHYDPTTRTVRLSKRFYGRRSVTATAVALHELGHALQHNESYRPLLVRQRIVGVTGVAERAGGLALLAGPGLAAVAPGLGRLLLVVGALSMLASVPAQLATLPVELDASFRRALPLLRRHQLLPARELGSARQILLACALTYVAAALSSLLNVRRWVRIVLRR